MAALHELRAAKSSSEVISGLKERFSAFGGVRGVSSLGDGERGQMFLIDFHREAHAKHAANVTGFKLFGLTSLIVNLAKLSPV